jgi:rubrerythrin
MNTLPTKGVGMNASRERPTTAADGDEVPLSAAAGDHAKGVFRCVDCGHAVTVHRELPPCPMCGGESWQTEAWRPFARALDA